MTDPHNDNVHLLPAYDTFDAFLAELEKPARAHIRLVRVDDQGRVEPVRKGNAFVLLPKVRVVASALDYKAREIVSFEKQWNVGSGDVTNNASGDHGSYSDKTGAKTRDQIIAALEARGFAVSQGEWTPESARDALTGLAAS